MCQTRFFFVSANIPLSMPDELMAEVRATAKVVGLSQQDVMRQSIKAGLSDVREKFASDSGRVTTVEPLPDKVLERLYREREEDRAAIEKMIAAQAFLK